ncbi:MAG: hypothetical protein GEV11_02345 [Streptosporangiales bacterium]|nr:hypothetical protein [Streptosporangiales bacterium]
MEHTNHEFLPPGGQTGISDRMRDLLARAAQDHVVEQSSQGAVTEELRQRLEGMEWLLRELREREIGGLARSTERLAARLEELSTKPPAWAETLAEHIDQVSERLKPVAELPALWADVGVVSESVDEALGRLQSIADAARQSAQRVEEFGERLDKLHGGMEAAAGRFARLDKAMAELTQRTEGLDRQLGNIAEQIGERLGEVAGRVEEQLSASTTDVTKRLDEVGSRLEGGLDGVTGRLDEVGGRLERGLDEAGSRLERGLGGVTGRLDGLDGRLEGLNGSFDGLEGRFEGVDGRLDGLDGRFGGLDGRLEGVQGRLDGLDGHLDGLEGRFAGVDGNLRALDDRIEGLGERITGLPGTLEAGEVQRKLDELTSRPVIDYGHRLDALDKQFAEATEPILAELRSRPDRTEVEETVAKIVESSYDELSRRLGSLEETMLALAEALLRPQRRDGDQAPAQGKG